MNKDYLLNLKKKVLEIKEAGVIEDVLEHKTAYQRIKEVALEKPDSPALLYFGGKITYRQFLTLIDNAANGFKNIGINYGDVVTMSMLASPYGIVSFYALDKIGATMHMVNCASNVDEISRELSNFNSRYFVANDIFCSEKIRPVLKNAGIEKIITTSLVDGIPIGFNGDKLKYQIIEKIRGIDKKEYDGKTIINFDQLLKIGKNEKNKLVECGFVPNHVATVAYTSGSTGNSKACTATWEGIDSMIQIMGMTELGRFEDDDVMFSTFPLWIYYSLLNMIHEPLSLGVSLALDPLFDPKNISKRNKQYEFNHWLTIPPYIKTMVEKNRKMDCSKWKIVITGGDALSDELKIKADKYIKDNSGIAHVEQGYGASECLGSFAYCYHDNPSIGSVGIPCVGNMVKVLDVDTKEPVGFNQTGVGYLYSPARMKEYYNDPQSTNHNLVKDENGVIWYNTEDLVHINENGEIFLDGRIRRIALTLDSKGNPAKIIPERTKKCISQINGVSKCEVITVPDDKSVNKAIAFVEIHNDKFDVMQFKNIIIDYCLKNVPEYMVPRDVLFVEIPLNASKKPDLKKLEEIYNSQLINVKHKKRLLK